MKDYIELIKKHITDKVLAFEILQSIDLALDNAQQNGYDDGYSHGYENGYASGEEQGYWIGRDAD